MSDLYTFNKHSNHVLFFKWIWGVDPTVRYKTMCPYFWSYVVTILILPFLLIIRLFGNWGRDFNGWMLTYRHEQKNKKKEEFILNLQYCKSPKEAYKLKYTQCWNKFNWDIPYELKHKVRNLSDEYESTLCRIRLEKVRKQNEANKIKRELAESRKQKTEAIKESQLFKYVSYAIVGTFGLLFLYGFLMLMYKAIVVINWGGVFKWVSVLLMSAIGVAVIIGIVMLLIKYVFSPLISWLECRTFNFDCKLTRMLGTGFNYIGVGFKYIGLMFQYIWYNGIGPVGRGIGYGFVIFFDTIYKIYKKQCPIITWED